MGVFVFLHEKGKSMRFCSVVQYILLLVLFNHANFSEGIFAICQSDAALRNIDLARRAHARSHFSTTHLKHDARNTLGCRAFLVPRTVLNAPQMRFVSLT